MFELPAQDVASGSTGSNKNSSRGGRDRKWPDRRIARGECLFNVVCQAPGIYADAASHVGARALGLPSTVTLNGCPACKT